MKRIIDFWITNHPDSNHFDFVGDLFSPSARKSNFHQAKINYVSLFLTLSNKLYTNSRFLINLPPQRENWHFHIDLFWEKARSGPLIGYEQTIWRAGEKIYQGGSLKTDGFDLVLDKSGINPLEIVDFSHYIFRFRSDSLSDSELLTLARTFGPPRYPFLLIVFGKNILLSITIFAGLLVFSPQNS